MHGVITAVGPRAGASGTPADAVIDGTGKYVMPGMVNTHMHWHEERAPGVPQPIQYERNLYLASGVTTARELGGNLAKTQAWQKESDDHTHHLAAHRRVHASLDGQDADAGGDPPGRPRRQGRRRRRAEADVPGPRSARGR